MTSACGVCQSFLSHAPHFLNLLRHGCYYYPCGHKANLVSKVHLGNTFFEFSQNLLDFSEELGGKGSVSGKLQCSPPLLTLDTAHSLLKGKRLNEF